MKFASPKAPTRTSDRRDWLRRVSVGSTGLWLASVNGLSLHGQNELAESDSDSASDAGADSGLSYHTPKTQRWKFGLILETPVACSNVFSTFIVPMSWPEQKVTPVGQTVDRLITGWEVRKLQDGAQQVALQMARVPLGSTVELSFEFDIERSLIAAPAQTDQFVVPERLSSELRVFMGNSPNIDTSNGHIKRAARDLAAQSMPNDWARIEQIYDFVRENVEYVEGPIRNASDALKTGKGDCEDMTSLFVALCRNLRIPARMVWIPDHCYPEFYMEDPEGNGIWFPCQAAGTRQFGQMEEYRPILQKGDRFKVVESRVPVRYVSEFFKCERKGKRNPDPIFIRESVDV